MRYFPSAARLVFGRTADRLRAAEARQPRGALAEEPSRAQPVQALRLALEAQQREHPQQVCSAV
jgi:hypothetical protein